ncbi:MAG: arylsulfatase [Breznakibacter sp.]
MFNKYTMLLACTMAMSSFAQKKTSAQARPNIVLVMVDDLGFSDLSPYGGTDIQTPNLQKLADEGTRFRQFYNNSISAPTRASLLTGQYQHKAGVGYFNVNLGLPAYQGFLNKESLTLAEVLKQAGYSTIMSGKWHVGNDSLYWPNQRGFDKFFGFIDGASNYFDVGKPGEWLPTTLVKNNVRLNPQPGTFYLTDEITNNALGFLDEQSREDKPFFLYLAYNAPHWPLQALPEDIGKYEGKYALGWDSLRNVRSQNAKTLGVVDPSHPIARHDDDVPFWNKLTYDEKELWQRRQEVYAAMIDRVDQNLGRLLDKLKELGKYDNTLIVFISDNGAQGGNGLRIYSNRNTGPVGTAGSYEFQNSNWSQTGNSPLRAYKGVPYEGGISSPFIAWFPSKIEKGRIANGGGHLIDLAPTFYELAQAQYPARYNGVGTNPLAGKSLLPVLTSGQDEQKRDEPLFWERGGNLAVRDGKWKLVYISSKGKYELYDIGQDRGENNDLAGQFPQEVERLKTEYARWAKQNDVVDYDSVLRPKLRGAVPERGGF